MRKTEIMISEATKLFKEQFGHAPTHLVQAPGRLELLGNHTDYNQGLVLSIAVDKYIFIASSPRTDGKITLVSSSFPQKESFASDDLRKNPEAPWADYVKGVLEQLRKRQIHFRGFNAAVHGTIPLGAGLSSSAAIEVATALSVRRLYPFKLTSTGTVAPPKPNKQGELPDLSVAEKIEIAKVCQAAENQYVGVQSGLLDQISSLFGKEFHAMELDFQSLHVEYVPMLGEIAIVMCNTGVKHELVAGEYNELRRQCEAAAQALGVKHLRAVDVRFLAANKGRLTERQYQCAYHILGEIQRVVFGSHALREGDFAQFGEYMFQSHESSRDFFKNSTGELDLLVELARSHSGCLGARLTGGGFGGATINLVKRAQVDDFSRAIAAQYDARTGRKTTPLLCQIVDGAK